jgi:hypothetical protein
MQRIVFHVDDYGRQTRNNAGMVHHVGKNGWIDY